MAAPLTTQGMMLGMSGFPRARPFFNDEVSDALRHEPVCCGAPPGPSIPLEWFEFRRGWVTKYFTDVVPYSQLNRIPGTYRCQVPLPNGQPCPYQFEDKSYTCLCGIENCGPFWAGSGTAPDLMINHVVAMHGIVDRYAALPKKQWRTSLMDMEGLIDACCCPTCNGSRQIMALSGWQDTHHCGLCMMFILLSCEVDECCEMTYGYYAPPHHATAIILRERVLAMFNIEESCCETLTIVICCAPCSIAQTHREISEAGGWAGGVCATRRNPSKALDAQRGMLTMI